ncbi:DNA polymerase III subunit beta [Corynebacterium argentoratense]|uniref:DNA polymerase III subunit beta n=1 Tax=Corynebacterium argentoratense TaxID=42817 RepID=UPI001F3523BC|nr:DNA polymerase III subunit beta [Corynebacterium argentoratense]MCF1766096.1 DNA polymerase III subunit beta [Corynebacterium argentoratense]
MDAQAVAFRVSKDDLTSAVSWVARNLPSKPAQPVLRAMVITATDDGLELAGFDYEVSTQVAIPAEVSTPGRIAVAGKLIAEIISTLPNKPVDLHVEGSTAYITCGSSRFELPTIPLDDYPKLPDLPEETGQLDSKLFTRAVNQVALAAGRDETLPMLTGVHIEIDGNSVLMAATDRFRLAVRRFEWSPTNSFVKAKLLVPAKTLQEHARTLDNVDTIHLAVGNGEEISSEGLFGIEAESRKTTTRMLSAEFPNFQPLLPKTHTAMASVEIAPLVDAIRRVSLVTDRNAQIRMEFSEGQVILSAGASDSGHAEEVVPCAFSGEPLLIAFNPGYLKEGLGVINTDRVVFGFTQPSRPAILIPEPEEFPVAGDDGVFATPDTDFTYLLMPVRLPG